jgi:monoterpene epsilon-lactone hydrolase
VASPQYEKLVGILWERRRPPGDHAVEALRKGMEVVALPPGDDITIASVDLEGLPGEWVVAAGARTDRAVLYLHGGGYVMGSFLTHRKLAGDISRAAQARVLLVDYRLAPEHPCPAGVADAAQAYRWLLAEVGDPGALAIAGDSAGGGLTVATLVALRDAGVELPAAAVCISPWVDCALDATSIEDRADRDPIVSGPDLRRFRDWYVGSASPWPVLASPGRADLTGLPPLLIHVGDAEVLLDDARLLSERADGAGVDVTLEIWPEMVHVWHVFAGRVPESTEAVERVGAFLRARWPS